MYLDPNFGSMIIQLIIGLIAGAGAYLMIVRKQVASLLFKRNLKQETTLDDTYGVKYD